MAARETHPGGDQVTDVAFVDAMADPLGTAGRILAAVGLGPTAASVACMESWMERGPQDARRSRCTATPPRTSG